MSLVLAGAGAAAAEWTGGESTVLLEGVKNQLYTSAWPALRGCEM